MNETENGPKSYNTLKNTTALVLVLLLLAFTVTIRAKVSPLLLYYFTFLFGLNGLLSGYLLTRVWKDKARTSDWPIMGSVAQIIINAGFAIISYTLTM